MPASIDLQPEVRAGDRDRDRTAALIGQAFAQGYLSMGDYEDRLQQTFAAGTTRGLRALTADLPVAILKRRDPRRRAARNAAARRSVQIHLGAYLAMAVIVLAVWLVVALTAGAWYFWPIWPILGGMIGLISHAIPVQAVTASRH